MDMIRRMPLMPSVPLAAQSGRFVSATVTMRKYLMLVSEAEGARAAQDNIHEWEMQGGVQ